MRDDGDGKKQDKWHTRSIVFSHCFFRSRVTARARARARVRATGSATVRAAGRAMSEYHEQKAGNRNGQQR